MYTNSLDRMADFGYGVEAIIEDNKDGEWIYNYLNKCYKIII